jgi:glycosyltransferase involved in cell wall biosynthesis
VRPGPRRVRRGDALTLVTAAIPTYNRARYVVEAVESVLGQTHTEVDVVVVDDGSTDDTAERLAPYLDRIRYLRQDNAGRSAARNTAVAHAQGSLVAFCDSDDRWLPDKLERQIAALARRPEVGMAHGHVEVIDAGGSVLRSETANVQAIFSRAHRRPVTYARYAHDCRCFSSTIIARREVLERVGPYDTTLLLDDYDLYLRISLEAEILFLDGPPLTQYRHHPEQMTTYELTMGQIQTAEKHLRLLERRAEIPHGRRARRNFELMRARSYRVLGDRPASRSAARKALVLGQPRALRFLA